MKTGRKSLCTRLFCKLAISDEIQHVATAITLYAPDPCLTILTCRVVYLPSCPPAYLSTCLTTLSAPACLPLCLSVCLLAYLLACLFVHLPIPACLPTYLPTSLSTCVPAYLPVCLSTCLSTYLPACLPVCLPVFRSYKPKLSSKCRVTWYLAANRQN